MLHSVPMPGSKFAKGNRWGYFPSAALAWRISSEPFMVSTASWLDDLKLRVSYGTAGNNNIPVGQLVQTYSARLYRLGKRYLFILGTIKDDG